jgi:hypothetical protein
VPEPVLDTVSLRVMAFAHPDGIAILLAALEAARARFPAEVYNRDEDLLPAGAADEDLSELARGVRYVRRQAASLASADAQPFVTRLEHASQISDHLARGTLVIDPLTVDELPLRERYRDDYGIGRGEAACLVLARRYGTGMVFVSSDASAGRVAVALGVPTVTLPDVLTNWVDRLSPTVAELDALVAGMRAARFGLAQEFVETLRRRSR